jgi:hypothetical protein
MGPLKTISAQGGAFTGVTIVEFSTDGGVTFGPITTFPNPDIEIWRFAATHMRVRRTGVTGGPIPIVTVGATDIGATSLSLAAPAGNGTGPLVDISALGSFKTIGCQGTFSGIVYIEVSMDLGLSWGTIASFQAPGYDAKEYIAQLIRVRRTDINVDAPGLPVISLSASTDAT